MLLEAVVIATWWKLKYRDQVIVVEANVNVTWCLSDFIMVKMKT